VVDLIFSDFGINMDIRISTAGGQSRPVTACHLIDIIHVSA